MTRRDWWLGILLLLLALIVQTLVLLHFSRPGTDTAQAPRRVPTLAVRAQ
jgi:hypothetical protein